MRIDAGSRKVRMTCLPHQLQSMQKRCSWKFVARMATCAFSFADDPETGRSWDEFDAVLRETGRANALKRDLAEAQTRAETAEKAQAELEKERSRLEDQTRQLSQEVLTLRIEQAGEKQLAAGKVNNQDTDSVIGKCRFARLKKVSCGLDACVRVKQTKGLCVTPSTA